MIKKIKKPHLQNSGFLIIPKPLPNELFSSWIVRMAYAHKTHPHTFENLYLNLTQRLFSKNIDVALDEKTKLLIQKKCRHTVDIHILTMQSYSTFLQEKVIINGFNKWITPLRYCPKCLRSDKIPYFRKIWRITFLTICFEHQCYLQDKCPQCHTKLDISKMYKNSYSFIHCHQCGFELKESDPNYIHYSHKKYIQNTKEIFTILEQGFVNLHNKIIYSFYFFDAFSQLSKIIFSNNIAITCNNQKILSLIKKRKNYSYSSPVYTQLTIKEQFMLFDFIMQLFQNYPLNLSKFIYDNKLTYYSILKDMSYISFWFKELT